MVKFEYSSGILFYKYAGGRRLFLILKRGKSIDIPKGHIESGENIYTAAIRESFEETGIKSEPDPFFRHYLTYWLKGKDDAIKKKVTMFIARVSPSVEVRISDEHSSSEWMDKEECMKAMHFKQHIQLINHADLYINKKEELDKINADYARLPKKDGFALSHRFVPGEGPCDAEIMIIGQAPGANEDLHLRPFIGRAGRLLDTMLKHASLRRKDIYITSVVQFFPPENRQPTKEEIEMCLPFLKREISVVGPKLIICLGRVSSKLLTGFDDIREIHGKCYPVKLLEVPAECFVTMHPAAGVRFKKNIPLIRRDFAKLKNIVKEMNSKKDKSESKESQ